MSTSIIEQKGIHCFKDFLFKSERGIIDPFISDNDKTPLWDGHLILYKENHNNRKDEIEGQIPLQVKSATKKERSNAEKYKINKSDLLKYQKHGGIIFIRPIYYNDNVDDYDIYIKTLLPVLIEEIILENKGKINLKTGDPYKTVTIALERITDVFYFEKLCDHFLKQRALQFNVNNFIDIDKVQDFFDNGATLRADTILKKNKINESLLDSNCYLYIETKENIIAPIIGRIHALDKEVKYEVKVNDEVFFNSITQSQSKEDKYIKFNPNLFFKITEDNNLIIDLKVSKEDLFFDYHKALKFMHSINIYHSFSINDKVIKFSSVDNFTDKIHDTFIIYEDIKKIFNMFKIDYFVITLKEIDKEVKLLEFLINTLLYGAYAMQKDLSDDLAIKNYSFFGRRLFLLFRRVEDEKYQVYDLLNQNSDVNTNTIVLIKDNNIVASRFLLLNKNTIITIDNFFDEAYHDIINYYCNELFPETQNFMLNCIHGYDETSKKGFLDLAEKLNDYFIINTPQSENEDLTLIHTINQLQLFKRKRELSSEEKRNLINLKNSTTDIKVLCCCLILLDYKEEFLLEFEKLSDEEKEQFKAWPIYTLFQRLDVE